MSREVLVVIGTGGMGRAIARRSGSGRKVLLADFNQPALAAVGEELRGEGHDVTTQAVDVGDRDSVLALARAAVDLEPVARIAHTAGLSPAQASSEAILRVDLLGTALVLETFGQVVAPGGAAVVIASMAGHMAVGLDAETERALATVPAMELLGLPFLAAAATGDPGPAYTIAKRANLLRVQAVAGVWGERGARVNSISPGVISTPMGQQELEGDSGEQMRAMVAMSGTGRLGTPDDIAAAAAFLLGPAADFITGTDLLVDGGVVAALRGMRG
ncbi:SDR family oxidoreductase [Glycomyces buryatensis]|uniref:SDR family oxidoreductase n=1 Tax=Glycomyces buryatensis TaxID=2570927 RepID=A0A4S8PYY1_9ACTN|nr:SDR family oxidoreductase [Glycomyces buryatensis]THV35222.1 SDR family oxidoreductase [Glycomyces buryatensis]